MFWGSASPSQGGCCASVVFNYNIVQLRANYGARAERNWRRRHAYGYALWTFVILDSCLTFCCLLLALM